MQNYSTSSLLHFIFWSEKEITTFVNFNISKLSCINCKLLGIQIVNNKRQNLEVILLKVTLSNRS